MIEPIRNPTAVQHLGITAAILGRRGCPPAKMFCSHDDATTCRRTYGQTRAWMRGKDPEHVRQYLNTCIGHRRCVTKIKLLDIGTERDPFYEVMK